MIRIGDHSLYVEEFGPESGPAVVLLHHGLGSTRAWKGQAPVLAEAGYRVLAYDRWGYGASDPRPQLSIPFFEEDRCDLLSLLDDKGIEWPMLVGHSDGGTLALYFAAEHPERVAALVTIAAHVYVEPKMKSEIETIKAQFDSDARLREGLRRIHGEKYADIFSGWFEGWRRKPNLEWDICPQLGKITCPALVVQGEQDEYATPQHAADIAAAIPGASIWLVPGGRHMLTQELSGEFNDRLLTFLDGVRRPG
ncbi:MAG: alpha/beta hydrolase [Chloroflexota bacterium]|nr:MAG: alpha/beta hydrolase [Chloroflexota bacterium]